MPTKIEFVKGDITEMAVDAIVSATDTELRLEEGVAGAIRRKGGARIAEECALIGHIALGETAVATAGNLKAFYVIHAAAMRPGEKATADSVRLATHNTLLRTEEKAFKSLALSALGTGGGGFSVEECAAIMIKEVVEHLKSRSSLEKIVFVLEDDAALQAFEEAYEKQTGRPASATT